MGALAMDFAPMPIARVLPTAPPAAPAEPAHGSGWTGVTKRIWLMLCGEGGFWSAAEIRGKLVITGAINTVLRDMVEYGCIVQKKHRNRDGEMVIQYGVVRKCKVPRGVTWQEIEELRQPATASRH